jgi:hypothetical protein
MSTPSLLNIPYLIKAGTLYSQIPETGAGDFAVTRTTSPTPNRSTRINADGFIERVNDNVPRLDYPLGGAVNGCPALLVEPSAENLYQQSEDFANAYWSKANASFLGNQAVAPDGTLTADKLIMANGILPSIANASGVSRTQVVTSSAYRFSMFAKSAEFTGFRVRENAVEGSFLDVNLSNGAITNGSVAQFISPLAENYGNGWYRISWTSPTITNLNKYTIRVGSTGDGVSGIFVWGAQVETGSVATSYIPTTTQAITRGDEVIRKTNVASLIGQSEGTIYVEVDIRNLGASVSIINVQTASYTSGAVRIETNANQIRIQIRDVSGVNCLDATIASPTLSAGINKIALGYSSVASGVVTALNGSIISTTTVTNAYTNIGANRVYLGTRETGGFNDLFFNNRIRAAVIYPNRLSNSQLQALTTP